MNDLSEVQAGDKLILRTYSVASKGDHLAIVTVERTTRTMIVVAGVRYHRESGKEFNAGFHPNCIELPTPETLKLAKCQMLKQTLVIKLSGVQWNALDARALLQVYSVLSNWGAFESHLCTE